MRLSNRVSNGVYPQPRHRNAAGLTAHYEYDRYAAEGKVLRSYTDASVALGGTKAWNEAGGKPEGWYDKSVTKITDWLK